MKIKQTILVSFGIVLLLLAVGTSVASAQLNHPPTADANGPYEGCVGSTITLDASGSSDPDGDLLTYHWDFNNDLNYDDAIGMNPVYPYNSIGVYNVGLKVSDPFGAADFASVQVTINDCGIPEFPTIALPVIAILGLAFIMQRRKN